MVSYYKNSVIFCVLFSLGATFLPHKLQAHATDESGFKYAARQVLTVAGIGTILYGFFRAYDYYMSTYAGGKAVKKTDEQSQPLRPQPLQANSITLYSPQRGDIDALKEIVQQGADWLSDADYNKASKAQLVMNSINEYSAHTYVITDEHKKIVGFVTYYTTYDSVGLKPDGKPSEGHIALLGVHQNCRRKGYGTKLLTYAVENLRAQGLTNMVVEVQRNNPAQKMFEKAGFKFDENTRIGRNKIKGVLRNQ